MPRKRKTFTADPRSILVPSSLRTHVPGSIDLHAGVLRPADEKARRLVAPPEQPLYGQLASALLEQAGDPSPADPTPQTEARAAVALCLRWGSYLGVLVDPDKPQWRPDTDENLSRITDSEMARLNIEISAAVAAFLELKLEQPQRYAALIDRAAELPLPDPVSLDPDQAPGLLFLGMQAVDASDRFSDAQAAELPEAVRKEVNETPIRTIANTVTLHAWRNAPVERIHAGLVRPPLPVLQRRITSEELAEIVTFAREAMEPFFEILSGLPQKDPGTHVDTLAARFRRNALYYPERWSLTETCRAVELDGEEPVAATE